MRRRDVLGCEEIVPQGNGVDGHTVRGGMSVNSILIRQAGVISRAQALAAGMSSDAVDRRISGRLWKQLHPRVYLAEGQRFTDEARIRAAVLWAGEGAVLSGVAAAWWWGLVDRAPLVIGITVPRRRNPSRRRHLRVRRRTLAPLDLDSHRGVPLTARPLTALEAAVEMGDPGSAFLDRVLQRHVAFPQVYAAYTRNLGAQGSAAAGRLVVAAADGAASIAERRLVALLRRAGVGGWRLDHRVDGFRVDVAFPTARLAVEVDGWAWHMDAIRSQHDKRRQNSLVRLGWTVLRYTWHDLNDRPQVVIAEIVAAAGAVARPIRA